MDLASLRRLNAARSARRAAVLVTDIAGGRSEVLEEGGTLPPHLADAVRAAFLSGKSGLVETEKGSLFLNVHLPPPRIVAIGAVHITQVLARLAGVVGFDLTIIDPRTAFATAERFEGVDLVADWPEDVLSTRPLDSYTALAAVTHDPKIDDFALAEALRRGCFYVGALGSRKTNAKRVERLAAVGLSTDEIARIRAPIGLDIGASSPQEIALAILAEIVEAFRRRSLSGAAA
ncbi:predicted sulfurylase large subunit, molybdopterin cytosine dinucleotide biosynthesis [Rhizobium sp. RU35A]|uniref:XdhC family protein n=1 Tax=Rhizobium sp. RU35A TaxID=1907414 RepID=UPI0009571A33|nr:XdhC family protein [Rhizobium sp. RU35A]SIR00550.1 predicted sulfurylase large subunit, molybdopterin cytosine dinucleotide biosynthesis [Rhizobium sp. RU35A]